MPGREPPTRHRGDIAEPDDIPEHLLARGHFFTPPGENRRKIPEPKTALVVPRGDAPGRVGQRGQSQRRG